MAAPSGAGTSVAAGVALAEVAAGVVALTVAEGVSSSADAADSEGRVAVPQPARTRTTPVTAAKLPNRMD
jgi:hypothetical protein